MSIDTMKNPRLIFRLTRTLACCGLAVIAIQASAQPAQDFSQVEIKPHKLTDNLYYLEGSGGNIGVSVGEDGIFLVDDQFAPLTEKIIASLKTLSDKPVRFVLNTHHHGDHTGGNENLGKGGVVIVAHENVRTTLQASMLGAELNRLLTSDEKAGLPVITYSDAVDFHLNGENIHAFHIPPAHTDGDSFVVFRDANVIHTGDVFRTTSYPRVDTAANGRFHGIVAGYEKLLEISDENTVFLPGHGVLSSKQDVRDQLAMFNDIRNKVKSGMDAGQSLEQIQANQPTAAYDESWGGAQAGTALVAVIFAELEAQ